MDLMIDDGFPANLETEGAHRCAAGEDEGAVRQHLHQPPPTIQPLPELEDATEVQPPPCLDDARQTLGDFRLVREIGRGGMGVVFEAEQISLGRRVALKVLPPAAILEPKQLQRFQVEAQAEAALEHPNVVPVIACGQDRGIPYLAMRLIEGRHLAEVIRGRRERHEGGLPPREVAWLGKQAAEALDFAHRNGVLHRDIKPANLLLDDRNHLWISDFGLARILGHGDLTASGDLIGTLRYMSPEQVLGRRGLVDHRTDIYSLGATLYELLTLAPAHDGEDRAAMLRKISFEEPIVPRRRDPTIPPDIEKIVLKALAKDPLERYATAGELAEDLGRFLDGRPALARRPSLSNRAAKWARRHRPAVVSAALLLAVLLIGLATAGWWSNATLREYNRRLEAEIDRANRHAREAEEQARKDRRNAAAARLGRASQALNHGQLERAQEILRELERDARGESFFPFALRYLWQRARAEVEFLVGPVPRFVGMARSPDGTTLATVEESDGLQLWAGSVPRRLDEATGAAAQFGGPAFSPDGMLVAVPRRDAGSASPRLSLRHAASGRCLASLPIDGEIGGVYCRFLGRGGLLATSWIDRERSFRARLWSLEDPSCPRLRRQLERISAIESSPDGAVFVVADEAGPITIRDSRTGDPLRVLPLEEKERRAIACSSESVWVVRGSQSVQAWSWRTGAPAAARTLPDPIERLIPSPDGSGLAAVDVRGRVHLITAVAGPARVIQPEDGDRPRYVSLTFSPDGSRLATAACGRGAHGGPGPVVLWETASASRVATFPGRPEQIGKLEFTPDGRSLLIASRSGVRLWKCPSRRGESDPQPAGHKDEAWSLAFSPDGQVLASGSDDTERDSTIKLWDPADGRLLSAWQGGEGTVASLAFSPDARLLVSGHLVETGNVRIWDPGTRRLLATLEGHTGRVRATVFSPDGRTLATAGSDDTVRLWDVAGRRPLAVLTGHAYTVHALAFSPDGHLLASASDDGDVRLWDPASLSGEAAAPEILHGRAGFQAVAFSPNGRILAAADQRGTITCWDVTSRGLTRMIHADGEGLCRLAFALDGHTLAVAGSSGKIGLWDPTTGQELLILEGHKRQINGLVFAPDGSTLASCSHDGEVRLWRGGAR
jgi:WD40 repeat protein/serine/threonine protein kinase